MRNILGISSELSKALQRKDQDIVNAITLVKVCKGRLQYMRDNGWETFASQVSSFCDSHTIDVPDMDLISYLGEEHVTKHTRVVIYIIIG